MTEIPREQRDPELSQIYTYLQGFLNRLPPDLDAASEYTQEEELTKTELAIAEGIFKEHELPTPLHISFIHQWGSLEPDLEAMSDMHSEIAAIHVTTDTHDVIYGFYKTAEGVYYTDRSVQPHNATGRHSRESLVHLGQIAQELLTPSDKEDLLYGPIKMPLLTGEVQPSINELQALASLVESLRPREA